jgi:acetyltransferase-like isoleucine patch superfamily enzyme
MTPRQMLQRFAPPVVVTLVYWLKFRCRVSPRAEVELTSRLRIGRGTRISSFAKIKATNGDLTIGREVSIGSNCFISADPGGVTIGDYTLISPNVCIIGSNYRYDRLDVPICQQGVVSKGVHIGQDVWIGAGCVITDGVTIGDHCIVTPNSVVSRSLPAGTIAGGSPASEIFQRRP